MNSTKNLVLCALFAALIAIGTHIKIPTPLLPLTLQTLFVVLSGLVLGKKYGAVSVCVYVIAGFGYILGFIPGAFIAGLIAEKYRPCFMTWFIGAVTGIVIIYAIGIPYYYFVSKWYLGNELGAKTLLVSFILMPMPGDIAKSVLAGLIVQRLSAFCPESFTWKR